MFEKLANIQWGVVAKGPYDKSQISSNMVNWRKISQSVFKNVIEF